MSGQDRPLHGAPFPPERLHPRLDFAEFIGTAFLVLLEFRGPGFRRGSPCAR